MPKGTLISPDQTTPVVAIYQVTGTFSVSDGTGTVVNYNYPLYDTHSFVTTGASWKFQPTIPGFYEVRGSVLFQTTNTWALGEAGYLQLSKNGAEYASLSRLDNYSNTFMYMYLAGTAIAYLNGTTDYLSVKVSHNSGGTLNLHTNIAYNYVHIRRIT